MPFSNVLILKVFERRRPLQVHLRSRHPGLGRYFKHPPSGEYEAKSIKFLPMGSLDQMNFFPRSQNQISVSFIRKFSFFPSTLNWGFLSLRIKILPKKISTASSYCNTVPQVASKKKKATSCCKTPAVFNIYPGQMETV